MEKSATARAADTLEEDSGTESDYDFVSSPENTPPSSPRGGGSTTGRPQAGATNGFPSAGQGGFSKAKNIAAPPAVNSSSPTSNIAGEIAGLISIEQHPQTATSGTGGKGPLFNCTACAQLLRDCVECPRCHSLFCRSHLTVDKNGESPCPCEPCSGKVNSKDGSSSSADPAALARRKPKLKSRMGALAHQVANLAHPTSTSAAAPLHPAKAFQPNIPVQRMADAVPSSCNACGLNLSWGELGVHMCDLQVVPCEDAQWGCTWTGRRVYRADHMASSTCPGRVARVENELAEARAELSTVRAELIATKEELEKSERRAVTAETKNSKLEEACTERLRERNAATAKAAAEVAALAIATAEINELKRTASTSAMTTARSGSSSSSSLTQAQERQQANQQQRQSDQEHSIAAGTFSSAAGIFSRATGGSSNAINTNGNGTGTGRQSSPQRPAAASATTAPGQTTAGAEAAAGTAEAACQAPVPATEACLRPYLERPDSLLEKKVVVFWPRQGRWYVGRPTAYKTATKEHRVEYDDGDVRDHVLQHRSWGLIG